MKKLEMSRRASLSDSKTYAGKAAKLETTSARRSAPAPKIQLMIAQREARKSAKAIVRAFAGG
jgi:hypothetical protein